MTEGLNNTGDTIDVDQLAETLWRASGEVPDRYSFQRVPAVTRQYWQRLARAALAAVGGQAEKAEDARS